MNWAMPSAPFGETASGSNRLSFQISRAKKAGGRPLRSASRSISPQIAPWPASSCNVP
jgi:hypothetical protein